jgi:hypothetical protein
MSTEKVDFVTEYRPDGTHFRTRLDRLTDGRVMCCICFEFFVREQLNPVKGDPDGAVEDVCLGCADREDKIRKWKESFAGRRTFRVLVTGSRSWAHPDVLESGLDLLYTAARTSGRRMILRQGGCPRGADLMAKRWCVVRISEFTEDAPLTPLVDDEWAADWDNCNADCLPGHRKVKRGAVDLHPGARNDYCPTAGHRRNQDMVDGGADVCLAFIADGSAGATHCADAAEAAGIVTIRWETFGEELRWPPAGWAHRVPV